MGETESNGDGRVTMAVLGEKMRRVEAVLARVEGKLDSSLDEIRQNKDDISRTDERVKNLREDVNDLSRRSNTIDGVVAAATAIAAFLGLSR